jgi:hypothetical protein
MDYITPQLTMIGSVSGVVLGGTRQIFVEDGLYDVQKSLESAW